MTVACWKFVVGYNTKLKLVCSMFLLLRRLKNEAKGHALTGVHSQQVKESPEYSEKKKDPFHPATED